MSAMQRSKGARFEREVARQLSNDFGVEVGRKLGQARDSGNDIDLPPLRIECKRYASIAVYKWMEQCEKGLDEDVIPTVIARADNKKPIVIMRYEDWVEMARHAVLWKQNDERLD